MHHLSMLLKVIYKQSSPDTFLNYASKYSNLILKIYTVKICLWGLNSNPDTLKTNNDQKLHLFPSHSILITFIKMDWQRSTPKPNAMK